MSQSSPNNESSFPQFFLRCFSIWAVEKENKRIIKGALPLRLSTVCFSHLPYIQDQLRKRIHISKPLSSCCQAFSVLPDNGSGLVEDFGLFLGSESLMQPHKSNKMNIMDLWGCISDSEPKNKPKSSTRPDSLSGNTKNVWQQLLRGFEICIHFLSWSWI